MIFNEFVMPNLNRITTEIELLSPSLRYLLPENREPESDKEVLELAMEEEMSIWKFHLFFCSLRPLLLSIFAEIGLTQWLGNWGSSSLKLIF